jgi:hypothetical protein
VVFLASTIGSAQTLLSLVVPAVSWTTLVVAVLVLLAAISPFSLAPGIECGWIRVSSDQRTAQERSQDKPQSGAPSFCGTEQAR